ncbi:nucleoside phosphorylase [Ferrimonas senticii]|uniref:nucleoside phosphorylase n=1 Tax=Ferrimonas senticii TaxID=394566 RepID=UPI0003FDA124|nr:nucleoside phosphorylase [Ferrimonas senticii]
MTLQPHILVSADQVSDKVVVCGEPARVDRIATLLADVEFLAENREFRLLRGHFNGHNITVCSTGIGAPSALIALEELVACGAKQLVRVGSAGALQQHIDLGDLVIAEAAVRDEGGSHAYVGGNYPAYGDIGLTAKLIQHCQQQQLPYHSGVVRSHDSFYRDDELAICEQWHRKGVLAADMETAALMTVGRLRGVQVAAILANVVRYQADVKAGVAEYVNADQLLATAEQNAIKAALSALTA